MNSTNSENTPIGVGVRWRKSSFSPDSQCVEVAELSSDTIGVRNSNHPEAGVLVFTRSEIGAWIKGCKAGEFDNLI